MQILAPLPLHILAPGALAALMTAAALTIGGPAATAVNTPTAPAPSTVASMIPVPTGGSPASGTAGGGKARGANASSGIPANGTAGEHFAFTWPLSPKPTVHRGFEQPLHEWSRGHRGVDLLASAGQPVLSAGDGVVAFSGMVAGRGVITVRHTGGLRTTYEPVDQRLVTGTVLHRGTRIGAVSPVSGHCVPLTCLHWGAISGRTYLDPLSLLHAGRPVLLPLS
jgi:murein DD-endopeptidase MepM/ murein hydrolase activator NlpD